MLRTRLARIAPTLLWIGLVPIALSYAAWFVPDIAHWDAALMVGTTVLPAAALIGAGLVMLSLLTLSLVSGWWGVAWFAGLLVSIPTLFIALFLLANSIPTPLNVVELRDGRSVMLLIDGVMNDTVYSLLEPADGMRLTWRKIPGAGLSYSEDHKRTDDPALLVSTDGETLLVRRGGLWTDCLRTTTPLTECVDLGGSPLWSDGDQPWIERSRRIAEVVGDALPGR